MILFLGALVICILIGVGHGMSENDAMSGIVDFIVGAVIVTVFSCLFWGVSYIDYIEAQKIYQGTVAQYKGAIEVYDDKAVINTDQLTDFGHGKYNESMASLIKDLRNEVVKHNKIVISKRVVSKNIFFGWYVVGEDDLKLLEVK